MLKILAFALYRFLARRLAPHVESAIEDLRSRRAADERDRPHRYGYVLCCDAAGNITGVALRDRVTGELR